MRSRTSASLDEPPLLSDDRVRIIAGLSGAGKTAWVAEAAVHATTALTYMDVGDIPGAALAAAVTREVAARLFGRTAGTLGELLLPGASPLETLGALSVRLGQAGLTHQVVLDNAHELPGEDVRALVERAPSLRVMLVGQPGPALACWSGSPGPRSRNSRPRSASRPRRSATGTRTR